MIHYAAFLKENSIFEPAWETPPFNNDGKECFLFFPQTLSDYSEYKALLSESSHVKIINAEDTDNSKSDTFYYTNSRSEITEAALYIRALNEKLNISWDSIAVCIDDNKDYEAYILREFTNRNIPFVKRTSKLLTDYPAGLFFSSLLECISQDFSFSALVSLILNRNLPWNNTCIIDKLIQFGIDNNCLHSWNENSGGKEQHINVWEDSFKKPIGAYDNETREFFINLKKRISSLRSAQSFNELRKQYFIFREQFFDMELCTEETDLILSRCISELMNLIEIEKSFPNIKAIDPFLFLTEYISETSYLPQSKTTGVAILPYKTAASAPFDCHIILGASQDNLSIVYSHLSFLPRLKRKELGITDEDAAEAFINLHKYNSKKRTAFFCSVKSFSDFAIPHPKINSPKKAKDNYSKDEKYKDFFSTDYYKEESRFISSLSINEKIDNENTDTIYIHENQMDGFTQWKERRQNLGDNRDSSENKWKMYKEVNDIIKNKYKKTDKTSISATTMKLYNKCSLNWLFNRVLELENIHIETSLMDRNISGLIYHAVFAAFFTELINKNEPLLKPEFDDNKAVLPQKYKKILLDSIELIFNCFPALKPEGRAEMSSLTARLLQSSKSNYHFHCEYFIKQFLLYFAGCTVVGCEKPYKTENDKYILNGFIDLILKDKDGKHIIVDYKTKSTPHRSECDGKDENGLSDFQLPVYITLIEENEKFKVYTALFYGIVTAVPNVIIGHITNIETDKTIPGKEKDLIEYDSKQYHIIFDEFIKKAEKYADEISSGNFTVFPENTNACFDCDYHRICRTTYVISRENNHFSEIH